jgi:hypothetical protein
MRQRGRVGMGISGALVLVGALAGGAGANPGAQLGGGRGDSPAAGVRILDVLQDGAEPAPVLDPARDAARDAALDPESDEIPEEVLRMELILGARSPIDGKPLSAAEYAELQAQWQTAPPQPVPVARSVEKTVNLLKLRKFLKTFFPFAPIK